MGSHWEKTLLADEMMVSDASKSDTLFTELTLSFLKDTGFYTEIDVSFAD